MSISPAATRWCAPGAERWRPQPCPFTGSPDEAPAPTPGHIHRPGLQPLRRMAATPYPAYNDCCLRDSQDEAPAPTPVIFIGQGSSLYAGWRLHLIRPTTTAACPVARTRRLRQLRVIFIGPAPAFTPDGGYTLSGLQRLLPAR